MSDDHVPLTFRLVMERVAQGTVRVQLLEAHPDSQLCEDYQLCFECTVAQDCTEHAQRAALRAVTRYINEFVDLSQGGRF